MQQPSHHRALIATLSLVLVIACVRAARNRQHSAKNAELTSAPSPRSNATTTRVDVNSASVGELTALPGIGPRLAQRIVVERARRRGFASLSELDSVRGIGPALLARIANRLQFCSQINGPSRTCRHADAVAERSLEPERGVGGLDGQAEVPLREPIDADPRSAADGPAQR